MTRPAALLMAAPLLALATLPALAQGDATHRCPKLTNPAARLACYDAAFPPAQDVAPAAIAPTPPSAAAAPPAAPAADFGREPRPQPIAAIESTLDPAFDGWGPRSRIRLANGQVWRIADDSSGFVNPRPVPRKVTVRRGSFGTFIMDIEGTNQTPRVTRVD
jgi:hypothetical protein